MVVAHLVHPSCSSRTRDRSRRGFTLIELLVVCALIALLISLLLPSLAKARVRARQGACLACLRQLAIANVSYAGANDGVLSSTGWLNGPAPDYSFLTSPIQPYVPSMKSLLCAQAVVDGNVQHSLNTVYSQYAPCLLVSPTKQLSGVTDPGETLAYADAAVQTSAMTLSAPPAGAIGSVAGTTATVSEGLMMAPFTCTPLADLLDGTTGTFHARHGGLGNVSFLDGHGESLPVTIVPNSVETANPAIRKQYHIGILSYITVDSSHQNDTWSQYYKYLLKSRALFYFWADNTTTP